MLLCLPFLLLRELPAIDSSHRHSSATFACSICSSSPVCTDHVPSEAALTHASSVALGLVKISACASKQETHITFPVLIPGGNVDHITELHRREESRFAMAQANEGAAGSNGAAAVPQVEEAAVADGAVPVVNGAVLQQMGGARVRGVAPGAGAPVAGALFPQFLVPAHLDVDAILLGPLPTKSNGSCQILPKIVDETWP